MEAKEDRIHCVFIAGRTTKQGQQINIAKDSAEYSAITSTLLMNPQDIARLGLTPGMRIFTGTARCAIAPLTRSVVSRIMLRVNCIQGWSGDCEANSIARP
jgi:hypothetical protein